jgi:tetratricopeptide (TPR) repeat protein
MREALGRNGELHEVRVNYGIILQQLNRHEEAIEQLRRAMVKVPGNTEGAVALATSLHQVGRTSQAIEVLKEAAGRSPGNAKLWSNLGVLHEKAGRLEEAVSFYDQALKLTPGDSQVLFNRGSSLIQLLKISEARRDWESALLAKPGDATTQSNLAILELLDGHFEKGFELFESRWAVRHKKFPIPAPEWDGRPLQGKHLMLYVEQGLGDMLQFCRFVPVLKRKYGCRITLAALPTLHELLRSLEGVDQVIDIHPPYPAVDFQCSLLSVPRFVKFTVATVPAEVPYLRADSGRVARWRERLELLEGKLGAKKSGPRVGLFWQGTQVDVNRTITLRALSPLWDALPEGRFVSLQKGAGEEEIADFDRPLVSVGHELLDFSDTAAVLGNVDLMITIDTAIAHGAGALARPTWVMLPRRPDWRWLLERTDSPWYPTMRLYRQKRRKEWGDVIAAVAGDLRGFSVGGR